MNGFYIGMIIMGATGLLFAIIGVYMALTGRGAFLIAGYNTMPKEEQKQYDSKALCKFVGKFVVLVGLATVLFAVCLTLSLTYGSLLLWITIIAYSVIVTCGSLFLVIYLNTGKRFQKQAE